MQALAWCPWQSKLFASGDSSVSGHGTIQLWNVSTSSQYSNAAVPGKIELDAQVKSLHFSPHCKEIMSTHGSGQEPGITSGDAPVRSWSRNNTTVACSVAVHSFPSLRNVTTIVVASKGLADSVLSHNGMKTVIAIPEENKLRVWDVWGKRKEVRRSPSFLDASGIR
jgi:cell division cycle protein 20 (cofactor of APC complex)